MEALVINGKFKCYQLKSLKNNIKVSCTGNLRQYIGLYTEIEFKVN